MLSFLCRIGLHSWRRLPNADNCFGMGLTTFENWECRRCMTTHDRLADGQNRAPLTFTDLRSRKPVICSHCGQPEERCSRKICPHCGAHEEHDGYCGVC